MAHTPLAGLGVALATPFMHDGGLDEAGYNNLIAHVAPHADFVVVAGTTGEGATLSKTEKRRLLALALAHPALAGKGVVYGIGGNNTAALLDEIHATDLAGVAAVLSVTPYYTKPTQAGLLAHYRALADGCPVPILLYNVPSRTGVNMLPATVAALAKHPNICGIKEAVGDMAQFIALAAAVPPGFTLLSGDDVLAPVQMAAGAVGVIGVLANVLPQAYGQVIHSAAAADYKAAFAALAPLLPLNDLLYVEGNPVGIKAALEAWGVCGGGVRLPLVEASGDLKARIGGLRK